MPIAPPRLRPLTVKGRKIMPVLRTERMYSTGDTGWRILREAQLRREPLCRECRKKGLYVEAVEVDHIDGDPMNNPEDGSNFQSLCKPHHSRKTYHETMGQK